MLRRLAILAVVAVAVAVFLLGTDQRLLLWETKVIPGDRYEVAGVGDVGKSAQPSLVCRYFTGKGIVVTVRTYQTGKESRDGCPILVPNEERV
jgi:hypothetical protein